MSQEIERKFLLNSFPQDVGKGKKREIMQAYLASSQTEEVRIRKMGRKHFLTTKSGSGVQRTEVEIPITKGQFSKLWDGHKGRGIHKTRCEYRYSDSLILEVDQYHQKLGGLMVAEMEFPSLEAARDFERPSYLGHEITFDPRFKNKTLAQVDEEAMGNLLPEDEHLAIVGTIPYILDGDGLKVVMITTRSKGLWIFPKGQTEDELSPAEVAVLEAEEEAGLETEVAGTPIYIPFEKQDATYNMTMYPLEVKKVAKNWDEEKERDRIIATPDQVRAMEVHPSVLLGLDYLEFLLGPC